MITGINIPTDSWNKIIKLLLNEQWVITYRYDNFDAGIDFDFLILEKEKEEILFGWDNWFEGEVQCNKGRFLYIEQLANNKFTTGEPQILKTEIIQLNRKWKGKNE
jgi:hypothetical protein